MSRRAIRELLGNFGAWLCNRYYPRNATHTERALHLQVMRAVIAYEELNGRTPEFHEWFQRVMNPFWKKKAAVKFNQTQSIGSIQ